MMYQTKIATVNGRIAFDVDGARLYRIGNMPVAPGDIVWTDGRAIYGWFQDTEPTKPYVCTGVGIGIPLFSLTDANLYVYTRKHEIKLIRELFFPVAHFANLENIYGKLEYGHALHDMDIDSEGVPWAVYGNADYTYRCTPRYMVKAWSVADKQYDSDFRERSESDFASHLYGSRMPNEFPTYRKTITTEIFTSEATPELDKTEVKETHSEGIHPSYVRIDFDAPTEITNTMYVQHGDTVVDEIKVDGYVNLAKSRWFGVANGIGSSSLYQPFITYISASAPTARINSSGEVSYIVSAYVEGVAFRDDTMQGWHTTYTSLREEHWFDPFHWGVYHADRQYTLYTKRETNITPVYAPITRMASVVVRLSFVINAGSVDNYSGYVGFSWYTGGDAGGIDAITDGPDTASFSRGRIIGHVLFPDYGTSSTTEVPERISPSNKPPPARVDTWDNDYWLPIQDDFQWKNGRQWEVYQNGELIMSDTPFPVGAVVKVDNSSYLISGVISGTPYLYKDGTYTPVLIDGVNPGIANTRLRYIKTKAALMK